MKPSETCSDCGHEESMHFPISGCCVFFGDPDPAKVQSCGCRADKEVLAAHFRKLHGTDDGLPPRRSP